MKYSLIVLLLLLNKKVTILGTTIEYTRIFHVLNKVYLDSMPMLEPIQKLSVVYFAPKIVNHSLVNSFDLLLTEVDAVLKFLDHGVIQINR